MKIEQLILVITVTSIGLMSIVPPWTYVDDNKVVHAMGYGPFWSPPTEIQHSPEYFPGQPDPKATTQLADKIDTFRLLVQIVVMCIMATGAVVMVGRKPMEKRVRKSTR